jgi:predicted AAA+ superfamily ATPase
MAMIALNILREVMLENRVEVMRHHVVARHIALDDFERQVLVGVRRCGKSYLLYGKIQQLIAQGSTWDEIVYLNFEDERLASMQLDDLNKILEVHGSLSPRRPMLFLDEIQNVEGWDRFVRRLADNKYTVYVTGSNAKMLSVDVASALGGRFLTREVFPLAFDEYLRINGVDPTDATLAMTTASRGEIGRRFEQYLHFGGFPECATLEAKRDYLSSLYQKIFLGDIAARHGVDNLFALRVLFRKLAESVMQPLSYTRAANIVQASGAKIGKSTIINYLDYAAEAFLILPVANIVDRLQDRVSNPKYYFIDNGVISLLTLSSDALLLENVVAVHLLRTYGARDAVYFYNHGVEVDFYVPDEKLAVQVCLSMRDAATFEREVSALVKVQSRLECRRNLVVTLEDEAVISRAGVTIELIPAWKFLLGL